MPEHDRRQKRSTDPLIALHYHLARARSSEALDALVVADGAGVVLAGAGSWPVCEELAAYAPLLATTETDEAGSRVELLRRETRVTSFQVADQELLFCARGPTEARSSRGLEAAMFGVARILRAAA